LSLSLCSRRYEQGKLIIDDVLNNIPFVQGRFKYLVDFGKYGALILDSIVRASLCKILDRIDFGIGDLISKRDNGRPLVE
jgi:hypothetical protein